MLLQIKKQYYTYADFCIWFVSTTQLFMVVADLFLVLSNILSLKCTTKMQWYLQVIDSGKKWLGQRPFICSLLQDDAKLFSNTVVPIILAVCTRCSKFYGFKSLPMLGINRFLNFYLSRG